MIPLQSHLEPPPAIVLAFSIGFLPADKAAGGERVISGSNVQLIAASRHGVLVGNRRSSQKYAAIGLRIGAKLDREDVVGKRHAGAEQAGVACGHDDRAVL